MKHYYYLNNKCYQFKQHTEEDARNMATQFFFDENAKFSTSKIKDFLNHGFYPVFSYYGTNDTLNYSASWFSFIGARSAKNLWAAAKYGKMDAISLQFCYNEKTDSFTAYKNNRKIGIFQDLDIVSDMFNLYEYVPVTVGPQIDYNKLQRVVLPYIEFDDEELGNDIRKAVGDGKMKITNSSVGAYAISLFHETNATRICFDNGIARMSSVSKEERTCRYSHLRKTEVTYDGVFATLVPDERNPLEMFGDMLSEIRNECEYSKTAQANSTLHDTLQYAYEKYIGNEEWNKDVERAAAIYSGNPVGDIFANHEEVQKFLDGFLNTARGVFLGVDESR